MLLEYRNMWYFWSVATSTFTDTDHKTVFRISVIAEKLAKNRFIWRSHNDFVWNIIWAQVKMKHEQSSKVSIIEQIDRIMHFSMMRIQLLVKNKEPFLNFVEYFSIFFAKRMEITYWSKIFNAMVAYSIEPICTLKFSWLKFSLILQFKIKIIYKETTRIFVVKSWVEI